MRGGKLGRTAVALVLGTMMVAATGLSGAGQDWVEFVVTHDAPLRSEQARGSSLDRIGVHVERVARSAKDSAMQQWRSQPGVIEVRESTLFLAAHTPTDPVWAEQWESQQVEVDVAWDTTMGDESIVIAVLDTGLDTSGGDFTDRVAPGGKDYVNNDTDPADDDPERHGTQSAMVAAAGIDDGVNNAGACGECRVLPMKVLASDGSGTDVDIAEALMDAADLGADIINMSLAGPQTAALANAVAYVRDVHGVLMVAAAGNENTSDPEWSGIPNVPPLGSYPAAYDDVLGVAAVGLPDGIDCGDGSGPYPTAGSEPKCSFSNYGSWVSVSGQGCNVTFPFGSGFLYPFCGTSSAAPAVAGAAGLVLAQRPWLTGSQLRSIIETTAADVVPDVGVTPVAENGRVSPRDALAPLGNPTRFNPLTPQRIRDTRPGSPVGGPPGAIGEGASITVDVTGVGAVPGDGVAAVVLNVTGTQMTKQTNLRVYPTGTPTPLVANLNVTPGNTKPNLVIATVGVGGNVDIFNTYGNTHVVVDVFGYFAVAGHGFTAAVPERILDTRDGKGGVGIGKVGPTGSLGQQIVLDVDANPSVPSTATAVVLNVTATNVEQQTFVTVFPNGEAQPGTANLNVSPGETRPNLVMVKLGTGRSIRLHVEYGAANLIGDLAGYYTESGGAEYFPLSPWRILDTREAFRQRTNEPVGAGEANSRVLDVAGFAGVPQFGVEAVVFNLAGTKGSAPANNLRVWPNGSAFPLVANLNLAGDTRSNLALVKAGSAGDLRFANSHGTVHVIADVSGYFSDVT